jgi:lysozyme family protein
MVEEAFTFKRALRLVLLNEGGDVSAERAAEIGDPGGATSRGVTLRTLQGLGIAKQPHELTDEEVELLYWDHYWLPTGSLVRELSAGLAVAMMDAGVQHGPSQAVRFLQHVVGVKADGVFGPATYAATDGALEHTGVMLLRYHALRRQFLLNWVKKDARRLVMLGGLIVRVDRTLEHVLAAEGLARFTL